MAKQTLDTFKQKAIEKHGEIYDYSNSTYNGLDNDITFICPTHGEVTQTAKSHLVRSGCIECDKEKASKRRKGGKYAKQKGTNYELKIIKELIALGYPGLKSSRSESKNLDNDKIDIAETDAKLPCYVQCKCTKPTPNVEKIMNECPRTDRPLVIFWNKQVIKDIDMGSAGEFVIMPKEFFYQLIKKQ